MANSQELTTYASIQDLPKADRSILEKAIESREQAYAPYSRFKVGAAVLLEDGTIVCGNNQENAVYPTGLCAERVAVFAASANYPKKTILTIAISCRHSDKLTGSPRTSCGSCRQAMLEYELNQNKPIRIIFYGECGEVWIAPSTSILLPWFFDKSAL